MARINLHHPTLRKSHTLLFQCLDQLLTLTLDTRVLPRRNIHRKIRRPCIFILTLILQPAFILLINPQENHLCLILRAIVPCNMLLLGHLVPILAHDRLHIVVLQEMQLPADFRLVSLVDEGLEVVADKDAGRGVFKGAGEEDVVLAQESHAVQRRAGEVVGDFFAEFAGKHGVDFVVGGLRVGGLLGHYGVTVD